MDIGDKVVHAQFGEGVIRQCRPCLSGTMYFVEFETARLWVTADKIKPMPKEAKHV